MFGAIEERHESRGIVQEEIICGNDDEIADSVDEVDFH